MNYFDQIEDEARKTWCRVVEMDGISKELTIEEFIAEMHIEKERVLSIHNSSIICSATISGFHGGLSNYFIANDPAQGEVCEKCGSSSYVILLADKDYTGNLDEKIFLPASETYYTRRIKPGSIDFNYNFPVPVNPEKDYWYCPVCNELHKFSYSDDTGLDFDQVVIPVKVNIEEYGKKQDNAIEEMISKLTKIFDLEN